MSQQAEIKGEGLIEEAVGALVSANLVGVAAAALVVPLECAPGCLAVGMNSLHG
jgi:hypothetical protein